MTVTVRPLPADGAVQWDAFVRAHSEGSFFHLAAWQRVIVRAFGHATFYMVAETDGVLTGILPLVQVKTALFGNSLVSVPFCVHGGPLATDGESFRALTDYATALMTERAVPVIAFRFRDAPPADWLPTADWVEQADLYVLFRKSITSSDEANLNSIPRKQRAMVRKGIARGLRSEVDSDATRLHAIYAESVRNLGTPVFARRYFQILLEEFAGCIDIVTILDGETAIASVMNFYFRDEVLPYYGGGRAIARDRYGNDFLYWEVMRRAAARGCTLFDFGRSKLGTGAMAFKKNWGFTPAAMHYRFRVSAGTAIPDNNPLNPKFALLIAAWKRLPIPIANRIGPHIVRGLG